MSNSLAETSATAQRLLDAAFTERWPDLRASAQALMDQERSGHVLQPTALVHEAYLRLRQSPDYSADTQTRVVYSSVREMKRTLIESARTRNRRDRVAVKVQAARQQVQPLVPGHSPAEALSNDEALERAIAALANTHPRAVLVMALRMQKMDNRTIAAELNVSVASVERLCALIRRWLLSKQKAATP